MDTEVSTSTMSRRERKKQATRAALRTAAVRLFAERGFHETTVEDITNAADLSPRTFFLHFASKEEVLFGSPAEIVELFRKRMAALPAGGDPIELARQVMRGLVEDIGEDNLCLLRNAHTSPAAPDFVQLDTARKLKAFVEIERVIAESAAAATGLDARTDVYPTLVGQVVMATVCSALTVWLERDASTSLGDLIDEAFWSLAAVLTPPEDPAGRRTRRGRSDPREPGVVLRQ